MRASVFILAFWSGIGCGPRLQGAAVSTRCSSHEEPNSLKVSSSSKALSLFLISLNPASGWQVSRAGHGFDFVRSSRIRSQSAGSLAGFFMRQTDGAAAQPIAYEEVSVPFPRDMLDSFFEDAQPGARIDSPAFSACNNRWRISLYPCSANVPGSVYDSVSGSYYDGRVGIYLRMLQPTDQPARDVDASFSMQMQKRSASDESQPLGICFRCGMTFTTTSESGESTGRCEDWGYHTYTTEKLMRDLKEDPLSEVAIDLKMQVWAESATERGAAFSALTKQIGRLPNGLLRVGEVFVALPYTGNVAKAGSSDDYRPEAGVEYRVMRLCNADGEDECFSIDRSSEAASSTLAYIRPTGPLARAIFESGAAAADTEWGIPVLVPQLPPMASRLGFRALPSRLALLMRNNRRDVLSFVLIGSLPLWVGFLVSQLFSAFVIPTSSMETTLSVGDVVLAEKISPALHLPVERGDLVLFTPPPELLQQVESSGDQLGRGDLFIKRVAALGGDRVERLPNGAISVNGVERPKPPLACKAKATSPKSDGPSAQRVIPDDSLFVLGDCEARSVDSRYWGPLPKKNVVARPFVRIWPPDRRGPIVGEEDLNPFRRALDAVWSPNRRAVFEGGNEER